MYLHFYPAGPSLYFEMTHFASIIINKPQECALQILFLFLAHYVWHFSLYSFWHVWLSTGGLYTSCPAADRLWLALKPVPRIKVIQPVLCLINKYCPSSSPQVHRDDFVETCWLVGLLLQHLAHLICLQYTFDTCECWDWTLPGTRCV